MSSHNEIVLSADPKGHFLEGIIEGTPKPGTIMEVKPGVAADDSGRLTYRVYQPGTDGNRRPIFVLREDHLQGKTPADAYVTGSRGFLYAPVMGDELQVLFDDDGTGTADDIAVGDLLIVQSGTGKVIETTGSPEAEPFLAMEPITDPTADQLLHVMFTGY